MQSSGEGCQGGITSQQLTQVQHAHLTPPALSLHGSCF